MFLLLPRFCANIVFTSNFKKDDIYLAPAAIYISPIMLGWLRPWVRPSGHI